MAPEGFPLRASFFFGAGFKFHLSPETSKNGFLERKSVCLPFLLPHLQYLFVKKLYLCTRNYELIALFQTYKTIN